MRSKSMLNAVLAAASNVPVNTSYIELTGGLDQTTAPLKRRPGSVRTAQNFEALQLGGYRRIYGYEMFDGQAAPSDASYAVLNATITGSPSVGDTLTGAGGATGVIIALPAGNTSFILTKVVGNFVDTENLDVGGPTIATADGTQIVSGASTGALHATYNNLAADEYRGDLAAVPGSGDILGVWRYNDVTYAFRNNAGNTATDMYKSSASGWTQVTFEYEVAFTAGSGDIDDGDTLTQGGVTATIRRVVITTGTLAGTDAAGILVISVASGGNFSSGAATTTGSGALTLSGAETAITLAKDGRFEFITENFGGATGTKRMYGVDGVNRAFEFDGTYFVPIPTGMATDAPDHIAAHRMHLFLSFGSSSQNSGPGTPFAFVPVLGSLEIAMGDQIVGYLSIPGDGVSGASLAIFTRNQLSILYGSTVADFVLVPFREELGAFAYSIQDMGFGVFLDDRGITDIQTSQAHGNFSHGALSNQIKDLINQSRPLITASCVSRDSNQYRLFFSNSTAIYVTFNGRKVVGIMEMLFDHAATCACSVEDSDGSEVIFFGGASGKVFQMEKGTSFDGGPIEYYFNLAYNFDGSPRTVKRYRDAMIELSGSSYAEFQFGYALGYDSTDQAQPALTAVTTNLSSVFWDSFTWDNFYWDGRTLAPTILKLEGEAENASLAISGESDEFGPFTVTGIVTQYTPRRRMR